MSDLPTGRLTFLFTDVAESTRLWEQAPEAMRAALKRHDALVESAVEGGGGRLVRPRGEGDSRFAVFTQPLDAVAAAWKLQEAILAEAWLTPAPVRVRIGIHTGESELRDGDYYGADVNRCARVRALAHPCQTLITRATAEMVEQLLPEGLGLRPLGLHRLKDIARPEHLHQLVHPGAEEFPPLASAVNPNNLPVEVTSLVGRDAEVAALRSELRAHRLVTLTGAGGCGKTRLSLRLAVEVLPEFPDGAWWVELAALTEGALVLPALAAVLGVREETFRALTDTLAAYLQPRAVLLVLDNCEHVIGEAAALAADLLQRCPNVRLVATSREALAIPGESLWRVAPLSPPPEDALSCAAVSANAAVQLFVERAQAASRPFHLTQANAAAVARVCRQLDGIPLALELAAALVRVMPVEQVASRLDRVFALPTGGARTAQPRQQTLRAAVDWGHDLLTGDERLLFRRLSIFSGGFTLDAAQEVCSDEDLRLEQVCGLLMSLVDKSFVVTEEDEGEVVRCRLLEILRQYGRERLEQAAETEGISGRHAAYYLDLARRAESELQGPAQAEWLDVLEGEYGNLRGALGWTEQTKSDLGLRLAAALWRFWYGRGRPSEGRRWLESLLATSPERTGERARTLNGAGNLANVQGDYAAARTLLSEARAIYGDLGDEAGVGHVLNGLGISAFHQGDYDGARAYYEQSLAHKRAAGDRTGIAHLLNNLGIVAYYQLDYAGARRLYEESLALRRETGGPSGVANSLSNLGYLLNRLGDHAAARALYEESLAIWRRTGERRGVSVSLHGLAAVARDAGDAAAARSLCLESLDLRRQLGDRLGIIECLESVATLAVLAGRQDLALGLLSFAALMREQLGTPVHPSERPQYDAWLERARAGVEEAGAARCWSDGASLSLDNAVELAREFAG